ncbi:unnamed protein product [Sympodiomycopsis kandeliae]
MAPSAAKGSSGTATASPMTAAPATPSSSSGKKQQNDNASSRNVAESAPSSAVKSKKSKASSSSEYRNWVELPSTPIVQGTASSLPVIFTKDSDYFCVASSSSIKIHSRATGQVVSTLSASDSSLPTSEARDRIHTAAITGLIIHPHNPLQLITSSLDGTVKIWDYLDAVLLKSIDVGYPVTHLAAHSTIKGSIFVAARKPKATTAGRKPDPYTFSGRANSIIYSVSLAVTGAKNQNNVTGAGRLTSRKPRELLRLGKTRDASGLQVSPDGNWLVAIGNRKVQIAHISALRQGFTKFVSDERLVSLAFHPSESTFATGDATGQIRIWHCLDQSYIAQSKEAGGEKRAPSTLLHWHAHAVSSLAFTPNGAYLLSGGEEAVLVLWQLNSKAKEFVPRLGAPISSIAVADGMDGREQEFVLGLADGSVTFVGALNLKPTRTFARVKIDPSRQLLPPARLANIPSPLAIEPVTRQAVFCGSYPSSLQFFDTLNDHIVSEIEVAPSNRVSRPEDTPLEPTRIERVAFSSQRASGQSNGQAEWMATIDSRNGGALSSELALKIWRYSSSAGRYILNTRIDKPHEQGVTSLAFSPQSPTDDPTSLLLVTTGLDKKIKTWRITSHRARGGRLETYWIARSVFGHRETVPTQAAWSPDGSLLAVAQGGFVTLWEPISNSLITSLSCPELKSSSMLSFIGRAARYIVVASNKTMICWDLVASSVKWHKTFEENVDNLLVSPNSDTFSVLRKTRNYGSGEGSSSKKRSAPPPSLRNRLITFIEEYEPSSGELIKTFKVPYGIRHATSVPTRRSSTAHSRVRGNVEGPRCIAIADNFNVFEVGESMVDSVMASGAGANIGSSSRVGETAQSLRALSVKRRTLFDDLFGTAEGDELQPFASTTTEDANANMSRRPKKDLFALFDAPSHLLPPVNQLFDAVLQSVLPPARDASNDHAEGEQAQDVGEEEDADEEEVDQEDISMVDDIDTQDQNNSRLIRRSRANQHTEDENTIEFLTDLFSKQLSQRRSDGYAAPPTPKTSAKKAVNGQHPSTSSPSINGKGLAGSNRVAPSPKTAPSSASKKDKSSPAKAGTKRSSMS